jgi:peptidoglycan-associated lipoprotein
MTAGSGRLLSMLMIGVFLLALGCSGRKVSTSAGDQATIAVAPKAPPTQPSRSEPPAKSPSPDVQPSAPPVAVEQPTPPPPEEATAVTPPAGAPAPTPEMGPPSLALVPPAAAPMPSMPVDTALADVYFDFDRFVVRRDAQALLETNARMLKNKDGWNLLIEGHCDERGTADYNLVLGERRAQSIKKYLTELGIPDSKLKIVSYGKEKPFCIEHSDDCWQQNRRAHFVLK